MKRKGVTGNGISPQESAPPPSRREGGLPRLCYKSSLQLLVVLLVGLLAYSNTFHVPFVIDDESSITQNPVVKNLHSFLFEGTGYRYNPRRFIGYLTMAVNYRLGGLEVTGYHVFNLAVHLANATLLFALLRLTLSTPVLRIRTSEAPGTDSESRDLLTFLPFLAALLFVSHPIQTQAVTYVVQRLASLATMFYLASLLCYAMARLRQEETGALRDGRSLLFYSGSLLAAVLAMKTKEISFTLPLAVALYEFSFFGAPLRKKLLFLLPLAATLIIVPLGLMQAGKPLGTLLSEMDSLARETTTISRGDYLLTQFSVVGTYLRLFALPAGQNLDYDYPVYHTLFEPSVFGSLLLLLSCLGLAGYLYRSSGQAAREEGQSLPELRLAGFGILFFFLALAVESSVIPIRDVIFEHRTYLPSAGLFCAVAALSLPLLRRLTPRGGAALLFCLVLALSVTTWQRNRVWGSSISLWRDCAEKAPRKVRPRNNLANALMAQGRVDEAVEELRVALELEPNNPETLRNLGAAYEKKGGVEQAIGVYAVALGANPNNKYAHYNLGVSYNRKGEKGRAEAEFRRALEIDPEYADARNNLGVIYAEKGMMDQAVEQFRLAVRCDPGSVDAHKNLGSALGRRREAGEAIEELRQAARLQPENPEVCNELGIILAGQRRFPEAAEQFEKAAELRPEDPKYLNNLYRLKLQGG